jgi:Na+/H+ antiporter NhaD/arsenite permease-like protein
MGAMTYIGNGPNFIVRSIAESRGIKMPGFGGYLRYSGPIFVAVFLLVTLYFLERNDCRLSALACRL